jgi:hypothetical protein
MDHTRLYRNKSLLEYLKWKSLSRYIKRVLLHNKNQCEKRSIYQLDCPGKKICSEG